MSLSGKDRRVLHLILRGSGVDADGEPYPLTSCEERILRLVKNGYIEIAVSDKAIEELSDKS